MESPAPTRRPTPDVFLADNLSLFRVSRPSVLLIGTNDDTDRVMQLIIASGDDAVASWPAAASATLPPSPVTLLVRNVAAFDATEQQRLHHWLDQRSGIARVIATSPIRLYELVERGHFLDSLYYRLNVVCLEATAFETASA
jgi:hypothetical protein